MGRANGSFAHEPFRALSTDPNKIRTATVQASGTYFGRTNAFKIEDAFRVPQASFYRQGQAADE